MRVGASAAVRRLAPVPCTGGGSLEVGPWDGSRHEAEHPAMTDDPDPIEKEFASDADSPSTESELPSALDEALERGLEEKCGQYREKRRES